MAVEQDKIFKIGHLIEEAQILDRPMAEIERDHVRAVSELLDRFVREVSVIAEEARK